MSDWQNAAAKFLEKDPFDGHQVRAAGQDGGAEADRGQDQDIIRGRRPVSDAEDRVKEWRDNGGNEAASSTPRSLSDNGRLSHGAA